jgi:NAD dependent epimerase/dehydratase family enzyme
VKIAIAGGTGFIGAHLIRHLRQKSAEILDDELFTQQSFIQADDFLADVCRQWERRRTRYRLTASLSFEQAL